MKKIIDETCSCKRNVHIQKMFIIEKCSYRKLVHIRTFVHIGNKRIYSNMTLSKIEFVHVIKLLLIEQIVHVLKDNI
jgi:hypothetical protein